VNFISIFDSEGKTLHSAMLLDVIL